MITIRNNSEKYTWIDARDVNRDDITTLSEDYAISSELLADILDQDEQEICLLVGKQYHLRPGTWYRFYLQQQASAGIPSAWLPSSLAAGNLLGVEELAEDWENHGDPCKK